MSSGTLSSCESSAIAPPCTYLMVKRPYSKHHLRAQKLTHVRMNEPLPRLRLTCAHRHVVANFTRGWLTKGLLCWNGTFLLQMLRRVPRKRFATLQWPLPPLNITIRSQKWAAAEKRQRQNLLENIPLKNTKKLTLKQSPSYYNYPSNDVSIPSTMWDGRSWQFSTMTSQSYVYYPTTGVSERKVPGALGVFNRRYIC